eukprot:gene31980-36103_t
MSISMREMLEAGVHFGHQTRFWNPKMAPYIFGHRNKIHIVNLEKTLPLFEDAAKFVRQLSANRGTILMVGTKRQSRDIVAQEARRAGVPFVDQRWLGGMLTNFKTIKTSIKRLKDMEAQIEDGSVEKLSKKEALMFQREMVKLQKSIGGIKEMGGVPDAIFVVDVGYHKGAITEAAKLGIPVIGVVDTNHSWNDVGYAFWGVAGTDNAAARDAHVMAGDDAAAQCCGQRFFLFIAPVHPVLRRDLLAVEENLQPPLIGHAVGGVIGGVDPSRDIKKVETGIDGALDVGRHAVADGNATRQIEPAANGLGLRQS